MKRYRVTAELDRDEVSPLNIRMAQDYLMESLEVQALAHQQAINWETFRTYLKTKKDTVLLVAWAKAVR